MDRIISSPRYTLDLDGEWEFLRDPEAVGVEEGWYTFLSKWQDETQTVVVPHVWQEVDECTDYVGTAWYRRTVTVDDAILAGREAFVEFGAVDYHSTVWLNGVKLGEHRGGYLPFEFEATNALVAGENKLTVAVVDPEDLSEIPHGKQGDPWYTRVSGIWQSVALTFRPETRVVDVSVTPDLDVDVAIVDLEVESGSRDTADLRAVVRAKRDGRDVAMDSVALSRRTTARLTFDDPDYWSPESPVLYDLDVTLEVRGETVDEFRDYFGMRSIECDEDQFLLNGEPIRIRGILDQGYYPKTLYRPNREDTFEREVELTKELGFNLIRKHIKPAHPAFLEVADRRGLLVWQEPANPSRYTNRSKSEMRAQLRGLVNRDYNRPSVVIWGLYNEEWGIGHHDVEESLWTDEEKQTYLTLLVEDVREWDSTRLLCDNSGWAHLDTDINDYHRYFVSPDRAAEWEADLDHICHHRDDNYAYKDWDDAEAPVMVTEFGTWALCDVDRLYEAYGEVPPWFTHEFLTEQMKRPEDVETRFANTDLADVFGDFDSLRECWQNRALVSNKHLLEQIRKHDDIAGYVLTELSDTEWEFNGLLDYYQTPKAFHDDIAEINADVIIVVEPETHVTWETEMIRVNLTVVNDTASTISGTLMCSLEGAEAQRPIEVGPHGVSSTVSVPLPAPAVETPRTKDVSVTLDGGSVSVSAAEPIAVVPKRVRDGPNGTVYARGSVASRLARHGIDVTHSLDENVALAFVTEFGQEAVKFLANGGTIVQIPRRNGEMDPLSPFTCRSLPKTENWNLSASLLYQDSSLLDDLCNGHRLGWEWEGIFPHAIVTDIERERDTVHAGYVEGWLARWGSPLIERPIKDGTAVACTFRIRDGIGTHPTAITLINRLIERFSISD